MRQSLILLAVISMFTIAPGDAWSKNASSVQNMPSDAPVKKINVTAEKFKFTPDTITVKKGTHLIFEIRSIDSTHEFKLVAYGIHVKLPSNKTVTVEIYASEAGEFDFGCHLGFGIHYKKGMKGKLIVTE